MACKVRRRKTRQHDNGPDVDQGLAAVGFDSVACAICDNRTTALPSPHRQAN